MISAKKLLKLARKWQKLTAMKRKRITLSQAIGSAETSSCGTSTMASKGHFVVYSADRKRFLLPSKYLNNEIIKELLNMAEEVFRLPSKGPLTLPYDAELMVYVISLIKMKDNGDIQKDLATSVASCCSLSFYLQHRETSHQLQLCRF